MPTILAPSCTCRLARSSPLRITSHRIPRGLRGTQRTLQHIRSLIVEGAKDFSVRQKAIDILWARGVRPKDYLGEIKALFEWVQQNVRYTRDPYRVELLHSATRLLELRAGDCDDVTILLGAMLRSIGHPVRVVVVGPDPLRPRLFTHVYPEVFHRGRWIALDATMGHPMGWSPRAFTKRVISLERRPSMAHRAAYLSGTLAQVPPEIAAAGLVDAVRSRGLAPRDPGIKAIWDVLRSRGLLRQDLWVRGLLQRLWTSGLRPGNRPRTAARLDAALRAWGLVSWSMPPAAAAGPVWPLAPTPYFGPDRRLVAPGFGPGRRAWLRELIAAVRQGSLQPRDPRVRLLWRVLSARGLLGADTGARSLLLRLWQQGAPSGMPTGVPQLVALLRSSGLLPRARRSPRRYPQIGARRGYQFSRGAPSWRPARAYRRLAPVR
jgi:Transglutaminase-like superfamily